MGNLPDLSDPDVAKQSLLIGFSYSLELDGAPGSYNKRIARNIRAALNKAKKAIERNLSPWIGMQWEIYDALAELDPEKTKLIPENHVATPPKFEHGEIKPAQFVKFLKDGSTQAARVLQEQLEELAEAQGWDLDTLGSDADKLIRCLNELLNDRSNFRHYKGILELHDLHRPQFGAIGIEKRSLPQSKMYPRKGLRKFQAIRVNRLIIESTCPDASILERGKYLSTRGVLNLLLRQVKEDEFEIGYVFVYGHPQHSPRCREQTVKVLNDHGFTVPEDHIYDAQEHKERNWRWDPTTAQVWCRSPENWKDYEEIGRRQLSQQRLILPRLAAWLNHLAAWLNHLAA